MNVDSLSKAVRDAGQSPCEKYHCAKRSLCASKLLACSSFRWFVRSGKALDPRMDIPIRVTKRQQPAWRELVTPTTEIFQSIQNRDGFDDDDETEAQVDRIWVLVTSALETQPELQTVWGQARDE